MKKHSFLFALLASVYALSGVELRNPGFETGRKSAEGVGWWWFSTADSCDYDTKIVHSGKRSVRLTVNKNTKQKIRPHWSRYAYLLNPLKGIKPDTVYTIRGFVKTDMKEGQAGIAIKQKKPEMTMAERVPVKFMPVRKTMDWTELVYSFKTGKDTTGVSLYCAVENFDGRAWFDDFSIHEGVDIPAVPNTSDWNNALVMDQFILVGDEAAKRSQPEAQTELHLISSGDKLMIRGICFEPKMKDLKAAVTGRDSPVWNDDNVELFLDAQRSRSSAYHFIISPSGALYDALGKDASWSPPDIKLTTATGKDRWTFELTIPYTAVGYGAMEAAVPDKPMAFAAFRSRKTVSPAERSSWQPWKQKVNYGNPGLFPPILAGTGTRGEHVNFVYRGRQQETITRPPLAWKLTDPLYEELMTDVPMFPKTGAVLNIGFRGNGVKSRETAFALQHGMKKHYAETDALMREMRSVYTMISISPKDQPARARLKKYGQRVGLMPMVQCGGAYYGYAFKPDAPSFKYKAKNSAAFFYPDPRVRETFAKHVKALLENNKDVVDEITLGHEGRIIYFRHYDLIRETYLKKDPEAWKAMEEQAKKEFGHGKIGFPESFASASPLERMVYQRFVFARYNEGIRELAAELRQIKPGIRLISELEPGGIKPYFYEQIVGTYDFVCQQMLWGNGVNRQSVAFFCKILSDLAETPARGGPHIEHYFVSLNPEEVNEVISSVFRVGGESLQLWLVDWFGKTLGEYYGAPERLHEIVSLSHHITSMKKLKFPEADTAVFFSNINQTASWMKIPGLGGGYEEAFTVLGPRARSWLKFISDTQLQLSLGRTDLSRFKAVYDPGAPYLEESAYRKLTEYVKNGGTLVVANPLSYSLRTDGSKRDTSPLLGVTVGNPMPSPGCMKFTPNGDLPRISKTKSLLSGKACLLTPKPGTAVLAAYSDGAPAITLHRFGRGKVITFAANPFTSTIYDSAPWQNFFRDLQQDLGCAVGRDIWRFRFPRAKTAPPPQVPQDLTCLTGNSWYYEGDMPVEGPNANVKFTVSYDNAPDLIPDSPKKNKLFNRKSAMNAKPAMNLKQDIIPWVVAWNKGNDSAVTFAFRNEVSVQKVRIWASGEIPEFEFGTLDSGNYRKLGSAPVPESEIGDVREIVIDIPPAAGKNFVLKTGKRKDGVLYLAEVELWGKSGK
ncbi:MAG: beta-galactosidase trimerization domain-containing protein [Lentisphaeria bacterium]|nr:beta-galactosidase trimerization domain-containing protein [Lentisphaeria bacterium]